MSLTRRDLRRWPCQLAWQSLSCYWANTRNFPESPRWWDVPLTWQYDGHFHSGKYSPRCFKTKTPNWCSFHNTLALNIEGVDEFQKRFFPSWSQNSLLHDFVGVLYLDHAQTRVDFKMCWNNWPIETFQLRLSALVNVKTKDCAWSRPFQHNL